MRSHAEAPVDRISRLFKDLRQIVAERQFCEAPGHHRGVLTAGLPWLSDSVNSRWIGHRLVWWPQGIPRRQRIGIASSRLGRRLDQHARWFALLRTIVLRADADTDCLCVVPGTAAAQAVSRAAELFGRPILAFRLPDRADRIDVADLRQWLADRLSDNALPCSSGLMAEVSPEVRADEWPDDSDFHEMRQLPVADRLLFAASQRICVLSCRPGGVQERLILQHLRDPLCGHRLIHLDEHCESAAVAGPCGHHGGVVRWVMVDADTDPPDGSPDSVAIQRRIVGQIRETDLPGRPRAFSSEVSTPLTCPDHWLVHWTRARHAPWPGQSQEEWLDELIMSSPRADRSALAVLIRIIAEGCLRASSLGIRGGYRMVSFTEVPLHEFRERHVFRKHRRRYDFEPWGVAISRAELEARGARPVVYGDRALWQRLPETERPWYQYAAVTSAATDNLAEREWRIAGDLQLPDPNRGSLWCFVDSSEAAECLRGLTNAPVLVLPDPGTVAGI